MPNPTMPEMVTTTLRHRRRDVADAVTKNNALMAVLRQRGRIKLINGGRTISEPIMYGENANFSFYTGRDPLAVAGQEVTTSAEFSWKQYAVGVSISGLETIQNNGKEAVLDIMEQRIIHAERTIANQVHQAAYSDGTRFAGKEFGGLDLLVNDVAGATVGGINSGTSPYFDNRRIATGGFTVANAYQTLLNGRLAITRGMDKPDLIITDNTYYSVASQAMQGQQRFSNAGLASMGFANIEFEGIPMVPDGGDGGFAQPGAYMLNCSTLRMVMHRQRNNVPLGGVRRPLTEDSDTVIIVGAGNFTCNNRALNNRITN